jgi:glycosyltransferase involved in cell wall biosynthesis
MVVPGAHEEASVKVSVFMPTYNQDGFLLKALDGLRAQTLQDFELVVCNDASADETKGILDAMGQVGVATQVRTHEKNRGSAEAINTCMQGAQGKYWTWVSSDNVMTPNWLEALVAELDGNAALGAVFSAFTMIRPGGSRRGIFKRGGYRPGDLISSENCFFGPSFLIRGEVWKAVGGHRGRTSHDYDHWTRVEEECWRRELGIRFLPVSLCDYYTGPWQATVARKSEYDAGRWRAEAIKRRAGEDS